MIVALITGGAWFRVQTTKPPGEFFSDLLAQEAEDRVAERSTWIAVEPHPSFSAFGPSLSVARVRLEHVSLFGVTS